MLDLLRFGAHQRQMRERREPAAWRWFNSACANGW
jgi:hypothetical protein